MNSNKKNRPLVIKGDQLYVIKKNGKYTVRFIKLKNLGTNLRNFKTYVLFYIEKKVKVLFGNYPSYYRTRQRTCGEFESEGLAVLPPLDLHRIYG